MSCLRSLSLIALVIWASGCASARMSDHAPDFAFQRGDYTEAANLLKKGIERQGEEGNDLLLYLLDTGLALHNASRLEESNQYLLKAEKLAEQLDYTSVSTEGATLLLSDNIKHYRGEDFEKILINTYLAMNFALLGDSEGSLVEARRVNRKLYVLISEGGKKYEESPFARYLSAMLYEAAGEWDSAYIEYKKTATLRPDFSLLGMDLWRMSWIRGDREDQAKWARQYGISKEQQDSVKQCWGGSRQKSQTSPCAEIIVLYENGISPVKRPHPSFSSIPVFVPRFNPVHFADVDVDGVERGRTEMLLDIERTAIQNLDDKYAGIIAKKVAGVVAKEAVGYGVERATKSPLLGFLTKVALYVSDQADVRSWNLLPRDLQVARIPVAPGTYTVQVRPGGTVRSSVTEQVIAVRAGQKVFVNFRYMP